MNKVSSKKKIKSNNKKLTLTINTNKNNEKITTLFSSYPKPLVKRYKFIKDIKTGATSWIDSGGKTLGFDKLSTKRIVDGVEITEVDHTKKSVFGTGIEFIDNAQNDVFEKSSFEDGPRPLNTESIKFW